MAMANPPGGYIAFGPETTCTLDVCPIEYSIYRYRPSIPASSIFIAVFSITIIAHAVQGIRYRTWGFMGCMLAGSIIEVAGYAGRVILYQNPFSFEGLITQIVCITIAPVFYCSAIYVLLSQVIEFVDPTISRFKSKLFYWIFIPCDVISLVLQAAGGAMSCLARDLDTVQRGVDISLGGLVFQVVTLVVFIALFADYLFSCYRKRPDAIPGDRPLVIFLGFLFASICFILVRCAFRIYELHEGYFSAVFRHEIKFIVLESVIMCLAVICLNLGHPGPVLSRKTTTWKNPSAEVTENEKSGAVTPQVVDTSP